jgi:hypothetical protein
MTAAEKIEVIRELMARYVFEAINKKIDPLTAKHLADDLTDFERAYMEQYLSHRNLEHGTFREFIRWLQVKTKPFNMPFVLEFTAEDWTGTTPVLYLNIPALSHNLLGAIEVNVYANTATGYEIVECGVAIDDERNITIESATPFAGKVEVFCSVGETPGLMHRQPVYTFNNVGPDEQGNLSFEAFASEAILSAHNNDPNAHAALLANLIFEDEAEEI